MFKSVKTNVSTLDAGSNVDVHEIHCKIIGEPVKSGNYIKSLVELSDEDKRVLSIPSVFKRIQVVHKPTVYDLNPSEDDPRKHKINLNVAKMRKSCHDHMIDAKVVVMGSGVNMYLAIKEYL